MGRSEYKELIESLLYVLRSRPDLKFILSHLAGFGSCWDEKHYKAGLLVLEYLHRTKDLKMVMRPR